MKKIKLTQKKKLHIIISAITSSVAAAAVTVLIVERKLFSDFLSDLHKQIDEINELYERIAALDEEPTEPIVITKKPIRISDRKIEELLREANIPDDSDVDIPDDSDIDIPNDIDIVDIFGNSDVEEDELL